MGEAAPLPLGLSPISLQFFPSSLLTVALEVWLTAERARVGAAGGYGEGLGSSLCQLLRHPKLAWRSEHRPLAEPILQKFQLGPGPGWLNRAGSAHHSVSRSEATCQGRLIPGDSRSPSLLLPGSPLCKGWVSATVSWTRWVQALGSPVDPPKATPPTPALLALNELIYSAI